MINIDLSSEFWVDFEIADNTFIQSTTNIFIVILKLKAGY